MVNQNGITSTPSLYIRYWPD